jgi:hypothetical protein
MVTLELTDEQLAALVDRQPYAYIHVSDEARAWVRSQDSYLGNVQAWTEAFDAIIRAANERAAWSQRGYVGDDQGSHR